MGLEPDLRRGSGHIMKTGMSFLQDMPVFQCGDDKEYCCLLNHPRYFMLLSAVPFQGLEELYHHERYQCKAENYEPLLS